jgi:predicted nucleotidyltransferase component of viral defense system
VLDPDELARIAARFGVDDHQVRRDHLISHTLAALSVEAGEELIFFGGTALNRTVLPHGRLSEDIDLIAIGGRHRLAERLTASIPRALRREFPGLAWSPSLADVRDSEPAVLHSPDGPAVRIQLLSSTGYPRWPTETLAVVQRYSDAPPATLRVPTVAAFGASKASAWHDRAASRDLWDLWAMATEDHLTLESAALYKRLGPTNQYPDPETYLTFPDEMRWRRDLGGQVRLTVAAREASAVVRQKWIDIAAAGS